MNHTSRRSAVQVGIMGLLALALLLGGVVWVKEYRVGQKRAPYTAHFQEVGNLAMGDPVSVRGVRKGAVTAVKLEDQGVLVEFEMDRDVTLHPDAVLRVGNIGFMGEKFLALDPGRSPGAYDRKKPLPGRFQSGVPEVISGAGDLVVEATELSSRLNVMLDALDPSTVERTSKNMERASHSLSAALGDNRDDLRTAILDFKAAAKDFRAIAGANKEQVTTSLQSFDNASRKLSSLADQLSTTASSLQRVVARVESSQGSLGRAIADTTLYTEMRETIRNTNDLVKDIRKNPKRYLKIGLF
ncbi:MAG TPA: MlaD family protein [Candidatus Limnocylindrales bacterium]|nr:MlaD family protein [Candidatus Limnocylindrales bacterium]